MSNFEKKLNRTRLYSKEKKLFVDFLLFVQSLFVKILSVIRLCVKVM